MSLEPLAFLDEHWDSIMIVVIAIGVVQAVLQHVRGKRLEADLLATVSPHRRFAESGASGRRMKPFTLSSAGRVLVVTVTDCEVLIKGIWPIFTYLGKKYGLTVRVPFASIKRAEIDGIFVKLAFVDDSGNAQQIRLQLKNPKGFVAAVLRGQPKA